MKLIVGLGNPGEKYGRTRHNVGFMLVDRILSTLGREVKWEENDKFKALTYKSLEKDLLIAKPQTFMNESGLSVSALSLFYKILPSEIYVIHDDLDLRLGEYKTQKGIGPKLHYGIASIEEKLGTKDFWRVRIGVDNRDPQNRTPGEEYVLQTFTDEELKVLDSEMNSLLVNSENLIFNQNER